MNRSDSALSRAVDLFLFSGLCPAAVAAAFVAVCHEALFGGAAPMPWSAITLAAAGTLVVYSIDRLRDLSEDGLSSPARTDFVRRNPTLLMTFCGLALGISALTAWQQPPLAWLFLALAFGLGMFHRRLKGHPTFGILYVAAAWVVVVVGLPALAGPPERVSLTSVAPVALVLGVVIAANLVGSELREVEADTPARTRLRTARLLAIAALLIAPLAPGPLLPVAAFNLLALLFFRSSERYGLGVLDGALLVGALVGLGLS